MLPPTWFCDLGDLGDLGDFGDFGDFGGFGEAFFRGSSSIGAVDEIEAVADGALAMSRSMTPNPAGDDDRNIGLAPMLQ
jgi:hypothetical protein